MKTSCGCGHRRSVGNRIGPCRDHALLWGREVVIADFNDENLKRRPGGLTGPIPARCSVSTVTVTKEGRQGMITRAAEFGGRIDILINNAGAGLGGSFEAQTNEDWEEGVRPELLRGAVRHSRRAADHAAGTEEAYRGYSFSGIAFSPMAQQTMYSAQGGTETG